MKTLRLIVALLSVLLMVAVSGVTLGVWQGARSVIAELRSAVGESSWLIQLKDIEGVQPPAIGNNPAVIARMAQLPGVEAVAIAGRPIKIMGGGQGYTTALVNAAFFEVRGLEIAQGRLFSAPGEAVAGSDHAEQLGEVISDGTAQITVVGILKSVGARGDIDANTDGSVFVNASGYAGSRAAEDMIVKAAPAAYTDVKDRLQQLADEHAKGAYDIRPLADQYGTDLRQQAADLLSGALGFGVVAALLAGVLNLGAFFLARALDGLRAHGIRRAVGATRAQVIGEDIAQAVLWALPGLTLGLPVAWLACRWTAQLLELPVRLTAPNVLVLALLTLLVVVIAAYFPARWAAHQPPTLSIRGVASALPGWQALLTAAGLALGTAGLVVQANTARAAQLETERIIGRIEPGVATFAPSRIDQSTFTDPRGYQPLTPIMLEDLRALPEWGDVIRSSVREMSNLNVMGTTGQASRLTLVENAQQLAEIGDVQLVAGRWPGEGEVALGEGVAQSLFGSGEVVGQTVQVTGFGLAGSPPPARVAGVFRAPKDGVAAGLDTGAAITPAGGPYPGNGFLFLIFQARSPDTPQKLADWVNREWGSPDKRPLVPLYPLDAAPQVRAVLLQLGEVYRLLSAALLLLGGAGLMAQLLLMLARRTKEIGVRRAVGANRAQVFRDFLGETGTLGLLAAALGLVLGVLFTWPVLSAQKVPFAVDAPALLAALGVGVGVALLFGSLPAALATRIPPAQALREGE